jgi:hypothetical protein
VISDSQSGPDSIALLDWDHDDDLDIVLGEWRYDSEGRFFGRLVWYTNDSRGNFAELDSSDTFFTSSLSVGDVDGDGHDDLVASSIIGGVTWFRSGAPPTPQSVTDFTRDIQDVNTADLDGDGLLDFVTYTFNDENSENGNVAWIRNLGGGQFSQPTLIDEPLASGTMDLADLDGDGQIDVIVADTTGVLWYENRAGGQFSIPHRIVTYPESLYTNVRARDLDGDGDIDIVNSIFDNDRQTYVLVWYESADGQAFSDAQPIHDVPLGHVTDVDIADIDLNGSLDIISASGSDIRWYDRRLIGDSNHDGRFDSSDLVTIFQVGEYEDEVPLNSTFDEGDWDNDGDFDSSDLIIAFQTGNYSDVVASTRAHDGNCTALDRNQPPAPGAHV